MNITVLANKDLASNIALNYLYKALSSQHKIHVLLSAKVGGNKSTAKKNQALQELAFFERRAQTYPVRCVE